MNSKQNALEILRFGNPEYVARSVPCHNTEYFGVNHQSFDDLHDAQNRYDGHNRPVGSHWTDIWGTIWHKEYPGVMGFPKGNPLADMKNLAGYHPPDPDDERICRPIYQSADIYQADSEKKENLFLGGAHRDTLWEKAYMLVGMENMMEYFYTEPSYAKEILHMIMDFQLGIAKHYEKIGVEMAHLSDDMGTQNSLLLSPEIYQEFLLPEYQRLYTFYKSRNVLISLHSCGHIEPLLETFMELGVNVLNPVQATANNLENMIRITEGRMALHGAVSTGLIMDGTVEEIRQTVRGTIRLLGQKGGYFCAPDQHLPFPQEKVDALNQAVEEFGKYPL